MKKFIIALVAIVMVGSLVIVGCPPPAEFTLTITATGEGATSPEPGTYTITGGESVTVTAIPNTGYEFDYWEGDVSGTTSPITFNMESDMSVVAIFAGAVFPWPGCFTKPDGSPYRVVFITDQAANLPMIMHTQHDQGIIERGGGEWTLFSADMDVSKQSAALEDQLLAKPDAIILHPVAADTTIPFVERGTAMGIDFYVSMMPPLTPEGELHPDIVAYIGDHQKSSAIARTSFMLEYFEAKDTKAKVLFAWGTYGAGSFCEPIYEAFLEIIDGSPWVEVMYETPATDFSMERLYDATMDAFTAHPDINAIIPCCGMGQKGIYNALEDLGRWFPEGDPDHVFIATRDAEPWVLDLVEEGYINSDGDMHIDRYSDTIAKAVWWCTVKGVDIADVNTSTDWMEGQSPGGRRDVLMLLDTIVMPEDVDAMVAYWADLGDDYYNWACHEDENFIKYPVP